MATKKGMEYLRRKLNLKKTRVDIRYMHYEMKHRAQDYGISTPQDIRSINLVLGWCAKAVDSLADRLVFREFQNDNFDMNGIFQMNNPDIMCDSAVLSALISACSFIYISPDKDNFPRLQVIDGGNATGEIDPITNLLTEGYAVLKRDSNTHDPILEAYFEPHYTWYYEKGRLIMKQRHAADYPLLVPVINRPDARRPFGRARISRACMDIVDAAMRTLKRSEISAEFYSFPQKWVAGLPEEYDDMDKWKSAISYMLKFEGEGSENVKVGSFTQQNMQPHLEQFKMFASAFGGETGLTLDDLGFPQSNPSSAEAIKAAHETLRSTARKAQRTFGTGFLNAGYLAACVRDKYSFARAAIYETKPAWEPIFEPDAAMLAGVGDAVYKINQAIPDYFNDDKMKEMTGY